MKKPTRLGVKIALIVITALLTLSMFFPAVKVTTKNSEESDRSFWITGFEYIQGTFMTKEDTFKAMEKWGEKAGETETTEELRQRMFETDPEIYVAFIRWMTNEYETSGDFMNEVREDWTLLLGYTLLASYALAAVMLAFAIIRLFAVDKTLKWVGFSISIISILATLVSGFLALGWIHGDLVSTIFSFGTVAYSFLALTTLVLTVLSSSKKKKA